MAAAWPFTLPQCPVPATLTREWQDNLVRGPADVGEGARRRRASAASQIVSFAMVMTATQVQTLDTFFQDTLGGGVSRFELKDPITGVAKEFAFADPYRVDHIATNVYRVTMTLIRQAE